MLKTAFCSDSAYRAPFFYTTAIVNHDKLEHDYNFQFTHVLVGCSDGSGYASVDDKEIYSPYWKLRDSSFTRVICLTVQELLYMQNYRY